MVCRQDVLKRFVQPEDKLLAAKVLDQADLSLKRKETRFTSFLTAGVIYKLLPTLELLKNDIKYEIYGGIDGAERSIIGFCPDYDDIDKRDFPIKAVEININEKFSKSLSHRDYLGSVLGLGIERDKIGDIIIRENGAVVIAETSMAEYIAVNLKKAGRTPVSCVITGTESLTDLPGKNIKEVFATVPSLRLDCILGSAFGLSRGSAKALTDAEKVQLNWETETNASRILKEGDVISARGCGRAVLLEIKGKTKKDRIGILIGRYV